jgi:predicted dehydrogenase/nucleoside-diphosphate-sugar epimerase
LSESNARVALVGIGYISDFHLAAVRRVPGAQVVGICDLSRSRAERLAAQNPGLKAYTDVAALIAEQSPTVIHVLTPPQAHFAPTRQILDAGISAFVEKPLATTPAECMALTEVASAKGLALGVSHNFLFSPPYERMLSDLERGIFGRLDQIDVIWNRPLGQIQGGPFGGWLFAEPRNVLLEVGPHSCAHVAHLTGLPDQIESEATDPVRLPTGQIFYRRWEARGTKGRTTIQMRWSFGDGYPEHYLHIRGSAASAIVDFDLNTYTVREPFRDLLDVDRFAVSLRAAKDSAAQATTTLGSFVLAKAGLPFEGGPFQASISRAVQCFYEGRPGALDRRVSAELGTEAVRLAEAIGVRAHLSAVAAPVHTASGPSAAPGGGPAAVSSPPAASVLVLGGTGFIGRALVRRLLGQGLGVRVLTRDLGGHAAILASEGAELAKGDFLDTASIERAMPGIKHVYHLARAYGKTWDECQRLDVGPTMQLADLCMARGAKLLFTSSIAIYDAGRVGDVISETTPAGKPNLRVSLYSRTKAEIERLLLEQHKTRGLETVIFRPGIVIGEGGNPCHWGVGTWPYSTVCRLWGTGETPLPFVLVGDCADAMVRALTADVAGETFNLVGEPDMTGNQYLDEIERLTGVKIQRLQVAPALLFAEDVAKYALKTVGRAPRNLPSYRYYVGLANRARYSPEKTKSRLGWRPAADRATIVREGIALPVAEFLS